MSISLDFAAARARIGRQTMCALLAGSLVAGCRPTIGDQGAPAAGAATAAAAAEPTADFATAPDGQAALRQAQSAMLRTGTVDEASLSVLRDLRERWPAEPEVIDALETALDRRVDHAGLIVLYQSLPSLSPVRQTRLGDALLEQGRFEEAMTVLIPLSDASPFELDRLVLAARAELRTGDAAAAARRLDPAMEAIRSFKLTDGLLLRGQVALAEGNPTRARALFEEVLAIDDTLVSRDAYDGLGQALQQLDEGDAAREVFDRLDALERANSEFAAQRMQAHGQVKALDDAWRAGDIEGAAALLDALLAGGAATLSLYERNIIDKYAVEVYGKLGRSQEAAAAATRVAEAAP